VMSIVVKIYGRHNQSQILGKSRERNRYQVLEGSSRSRAQEIEAGQRLNLIFVFKEIMEHNILLL
jgi:hypothetical protein